MNHTYNCTSDPRQYFTSSILNASFYDPLNKYRLHSKYCIINVREYRRGNQNEQSRETGNLEYINSDREGHLKTKLYDKRDYFNFPIVNFPIICSNISAAPAYGIYISQLIRYSRACDFRGFSTSGTYPWSFVTQIFHNGPPSHSGDRKTFEVMTST
jgi:hypothetical protein